MSKTRYREMRKEALVERSEIIGHYSAKYFNLFLNRFKFEGIPDQAVAFIMRQFWKNGTIACFKMPESEGSDMFEAGMPMFCPYAPMAFNLYHYPTIVTLIALYGTKFVPLTPQVVDKDVCIGWIQRNKEPICAVVNYFTRRLASIDMVLQVNLNTQKFPWLIGTSPESETKARVLSDLLLEDNPRLFIELEEIDKAKALVSGAPYVIDKLYNYKIAMENELREYLGLSNLGVGEKKEHLLMGEIAANNEITAASSDVFLDCLTEFFDRIRDNLGMDINVELNAPTQYAEDTVDADEDEMEKGTGESPMQGGQVR